MRQPAPIPELRASVRYPTCAAVLLAIALVYPVSAQDRGGLCQRTTLGVRRAMTENGGYVRYALALAYERR
jgi:hypothetical protein